MLNEAVKIFRFMLERAADTNDSPIFADPSSDRHYLKYAGATACYFSFCVRVLRIY
jgi:hypothetical protein